MNSRRYKVRIPDLDYYLENINCQFACPVHTDSGGYVRAIAEGDLEKAYTLARAPNPFPYVCGRVCGHPCESACRRGEFDQPLAIRALKRTATDHHNIKLGHGPKPSSIQVKKEKVAVIGSGPAGLSAAHDLARSGYQVTIFEASSVAGGMMYLGIPEYRLPREIIKMEVEEILSLGVELKLNTLLGERFFLGDLKNEGYRAVFIAIGAHKSKELKIEGAELDGVLRGVEFLLNVNLGYKVYLGEKVLIIGGGNVALDVARSALRRVESLKGLSEEEIKAALEITQTALQQVIQIREQEIEGMEVAMDVARSALRLGVKEVHMVCLESRTEMPAHDWEIEEAIREGVTLHTSLGPKRILGKEGKVKGLETIRVASVFDSQGKFNPTFIEGTESIMGADSIVLAIGQSPDLSFLKENDNVQITSKGTIQIDPETLATTAPGIFAGGDVAFGPRLLIDAIADGKKAARSIDEYLKAGAGGMLQRGTMVPVDEIYEDFDKVERQEPPTIPLDRRMGIDEVELGFPLEEAKREGERCLKCHLNTIFDSEKCILCGGCVDVCPFYCLKMVRIGEIEGGEDLAKLVEARYGTPLDRFQKGTEELKLSEEGIAMIKDETLCIRCGLCVEYCPTGAITLEALQVEEVEENASGR